MMSDLRDLYQEIILDHNRRPRNFGDLPGANHTAEGFNPLCGDRIKLRLKVEDGIVTDVAFEGAGCAISTASASVMTEVIKGKTIDEAQQLFGEMIDLLTTDADASAALAAESPPSPEQAKLAVFSGVREFPVRVKCASLAWHTLRAALEGEAEAVKTE